MGRKVLILANVGNRDVLLGGEELRPAREKGAEISARFDEVSKDVSLPIIAPALEYISRVWKIESPNLGLFYTDQSDERYRASDTLEFAKIIKRKLLNPRRKENVNVRFDGGKSVRTFPIGHSPNRYDDMYGFYQVFFDQYDGVQDPKNLLCFVLTSGGTPAMNMALILHAVQCFGENCVQIHISPEGEVSDMRVGEEITRAAIERRFNEALSTLQFRAAAEILYSSERGGYRVSACRYAEARLAFDFRRADVACREAIRTSEGDTKNYLEGHSRVAQSLERGVSTDDQSLLIAELFYNLEVKHRCGEFVDVLGRCFRLQEALLTWIMESNTEIRNADKARLSKQEKAIEKTEGLWDFLNNYKLPNGEPLNLSYQINRISLMAVAEYLCMAESGLSDEKREQATRTVETANLIERLAELRNSAIVAHGFRGMSEDSLKEEYGSETLIEDLRTSVGEALGRDLSRNPFVELAEKLRF